MTHWLLIVGSVLVFASAALKWIYFAFSHHPLVCSCPCSKTGTDPTFFYSFLWSSWDRCSYVVLSLLWRSATYLALAQSLSSSLYGSQRHARLLLDSRVYLAGSLSRLRSFQLSEIFQKLIFRRIMGPLKSIRGNLSLTPFGTVLSLRVLSSVLGGIVLGSDRC